MKAIVRLSLLLLIAYFVTGCTRKEVIVPANPIVGSWILTGASEGDAYGWQPFYSGVENGIFDLYSNGTALYTEGSISMQGNWYITTVSGGYYDEYGGYYNGIHQALELHLSDYYSHSYIDLSFDNVRFTGNQFVATYFNGSYIERYFFARY